MDETTMPRCADATGVGLSMDMIDALAQAEERQNGEYDNHESNQIDQAIHDTLQGLFATTNDGWSAKFLEGATFALISPRASQRCFACETDPSNKRKCGPLAGAASLHAVRGVRSMQVVTVRVHHLGPGRDEVLDELLLGV